MHKTKLLLIKKGIEIMSDKGFHATSIRDVILAAGIPKGSFYYYFESKEIYCLEIINHLSETIGEISKKHSSLQADFESKMVQDYLEEIFSKDNTGVLILKLAVELSERSDYLGDALQQLIHAVILVVTEIIAKNEKISQPQELAEILVFSRIGLKCKELQADNSPKFNQQIAENLYKVFLER